MPGLFDVGAPDVPGSEPPDYGTTPLEQVWYLTNGLSDDILIDFSQDPPLVTCEGVVGSSPGAEGTAVFTRPATGELLLYSDGDTVLNGQTHQMVANGDDLTGDSSCTEAALITPFPGQDDVFYLLTNATNTTSNSSISYSIVDMNLGPNGTVTTKNQVFMTGNPGEALDMVPHSNGTDFWILTYSGASAVHSYLVDSTGVSLSPMVSATGLTGQVLRASINHSESFDRLLLSAHQGSNCGFIATADINRETGIVSNVVSHVENCNGIGFQASFSPDATKVYYAEGSEGFNGTPWQYDLTTNTPTQLSTMFGFAATKLAPDNKIYWVGYNFSSLAVVNHPDEPGVQAGFQLDGLDLEGCESGWSVPNQTSAFLDFLFPEG